MTENQLSVQSQAGSDTFRAFSSENYTQRSPVVTFSPPTLSVVPVSVSLAVPGFPDARIYYTTDGTHPSPSYSNRYRAPLAVSSAQKLTAVAVVEGMSVGPISTAFYRSVDQLVPVEIDSDFEHVPVTATLSHPTPGVEIEYALNGGEFTEYCSPIYLPSPATLVAKASKPGFKDSALGSRAWSAARLPSVVIAPASGKVGELITASCPGHDDALIYYSIDGEMTPYTGPFAISTPSTVFLHASKTGYQDSPISYIVVEAMLPAPNIAPLARNSLAPTSLAMSTPGHPDANVHFTITSGGKTVTGVYDPKYPPFVSSSAVVTAVSRKLGWLDSAVSLTKVASASVLPEVVITRAAGKIALKLDHDYPGAMIVYATDRVSPPISSQTATFYTTPFNATTVATQAVLNVNGFYKLGKVSVYP